MKNKIIFSFCLFIINSNILAMDIHETYKQFLKSIDTFLQKNEPTESDYQLLNTVQQNIIHLIKTLDPLPHWDNNLERTINSFLAIRNFSLLDPTSEKILFEKLITKVNEEVSQIRTQPPKDIQTDIQTYLNQSVQPLDKKAAITSLQKIQSDLKKDYHDLASTAVRTLMAINILELEQDRTLHEFLLKVKLAISSLYFGTYPHQLCTYLKAMFNTQLLSSIIGRNDIAILLINLQKVVNARGLRDEASQQSFVDFTGASAAIAAIIKRVNKDKERPHLTNDTEFIRQLCNKLFSPQVNLSSTPVPAPRTPRIETPISQPSENPQIPSPVAKAAVYQQRTPQKKIENTQPQDARVGASKKQQQNIAPQPSTPTQPQSGPSWRQEMIQGIQNWVKSIGNGISSFINQISNYFRPANK